MEKSLLSIRLTIETRLLRKDPSCMSRFKIPKMPSTVNKTIRFPQAIVDQVELELRGTNCNFSQFVIEAVRVALENLEEDRAAEQNRQTQETAHTEKQMD